MELRRLRSVPGKEKSKCKMSHAVSKPRAFGK